MFNSLGDMLNSVKIESKGSATSIGSKKNGSKQLYDFKTDFKN